MKLTLSQYKTLKVKLSFTLIDNDISVTRLIIGDFIDVDMYPFKESLGYLSEDLGLVYRTGDKSVIVMVVKNSAVTIGDDFVQITDSDKHEHVFKAKDIGIELVLDNLLQL